MEIRDCNVAFKEVPACHGEKEFHSVPIESPMISPRASVRLSFRV